MMTETEQALARELARHPAWKWMNGIRLLYVGPHRLGLDEKRVDNGDRKEPREGWIPDLSDAATQGCLWAMLREATGDEGASAGYARDGWSCDPFGIETEPPGWRAFWSTEREPFGNIDVNCATLGEALARAWLRAAP